MPTKQVLPEQQPAQFAALHVGVPTHVPPPPVWAPHVVAVSLQLTHCCPVLPHAAVAVPEAHVAPTQHPVQLVELQVGPVVEQVRVVASQSRPSAVHETH